MIQVKRIARSIALLCGVAALCGAPLAAYADPGLQIGGTMESDGNCPSSTVIPVAGPGRPIYINNLGQVCTNSSATLTGSTSNASSGVATTSTNVATVAYNYGFNGTTWDQLQVDGSKYLDVDVKAGGFTGSVSNASSGVATSSTNVGSVSYNYGFNGTTWDQLQVDGSKYLDIDCKSGCASGSTSNASSGVATSSTNVPGVSYLYGFNGTTWDQLQVDGSKYLKINCVTGCSSSGGSSLADEGTFTQGTTSFTVGGCIYNTSITNLTSGQGGAFQCTNSRKLITSSEGATGATVSANGTFIGGGAAAGAGNLTGITVKAGSTLNAATDTSLVVDAIASGNLITAVNAGVGTTGTAVVTNSLQVAGSDGTDTRTISTDTSGRVLLGATTNTIGQVGLAAVTGNGANFKRIQVANNTTSIAVCTGACTFLGAVLENNSSTIAYLKTYNIAQGSTTCGTSTVSDEYMIPANSNGAGISFPSVAGGIGAAYGTALSVCITGGYADNDTTAPAATTYIVTIYYK